MILANIYKLDEETKVDLTEEVTLKLITKGEEPTGKEEDDVS